jgi:hypothetical protein
LVADMAIVHLDHSNCETACYRCLKSYQNQRHHEYLRWPTVLPHLQSLAAESPSQRPLETGDIQNPGPWLEAYSEGEGSPLELAFARLFAKHGFNPARQAAISLGDGKPPITVADFAVPERRTCDICRRSRVSRASVITISLRRATRVHRAACPANLIGYGRRRPRHWIPEVAAFKVA